MKPKIVGKPHPFHIPLERRRFLKAMALASGAWTFPGYLAEALTIAPQVTQGPYYPTPNTMPLEKDNDRPRDRLVSDRDHLVDIALRNGQRTNRGTRDGDAIGDRRDRVLDELS